MRILVASDLTARSDRALARGFLLARETGAELLILHVVDRDLPEAFRAHSLDWARASLGAEAARLGAATGVKARVEVCAGDMASDIVRYAGLHGADLLVLGVHARRAGAGKAFAETTAGKVLKSSLATALLVRNAPEEAYRDVVVGVDFSMSSRAAVRQALKIAPAARLHLVHAYQVPFKGLLGPGVYPDELAYEQRMELDTFLAEEMAALEGRARDLGAIPGRIEKAVVEGQAPPVLREACVRAGTDLVVIATHGRSGITRAIWGSVAADLLNDPPADVLVIKPF